MDVAAGVQSDISVKVESKADKTYDQRIAIPEEKQIAYVLNIAFLQGETDINYNGEYTITMPIPEEFINKDGLRALYTINGETFEKQVEIEDGYVHLTLTGTGDIVFIANTHGSMVYLYWLVIVLLFLDALLGMILLIMVVAYQDALTRRRELNAYSSILPVALLLGAVIAGELAVVVFLGVVFVAEIVGIAYLGLKLTNKYFIYTTYHKMEMPKIKKYEDVVQEYKQNEENKE